MKNEWKEMLDLSNGITAVYNKEELMIQQYPHLITPISKKLEKKVFRWLANKKIEEGDKKLLKSLLDEEYEKEVRMTS